MIRRILLPVIFAVLAWGFWISPDFNEIAAGIAIFLFGMIFLEDGFHTFTGGLLERLLAKTTDRYWKSLMFGIATTTMMQSSSLVSVITISFLSAGLISLAAGIGIIFGANLGTTTGAWLVAGFGLKVKISAYAMPMLAFGVILVFQSSRTLKGIGYVLSGLGLLFLGIHHMKEGFDAFKQTIDLTRFQMAGLAGLMVFSLVGTVATVIMQSSHATLVLIITALAAGQVSYENALALAIGANIGTTITAIIGSLSANHQGKRLALAHLFFNIVTGIIAIGFIHQFILAVEWISGRIGIEDGNYTLKLALFHTLFNSVGILLMSPTIGIMVNALVRILPEPRIAFIEPKYLNDSAMEFPETFFEAAKNETFHLYDNALEIITHGLNLHRHLVQSDIDMAEYLDRDRTLMEIDLDAKYAQSVKSLHSAIVAFLSRAQVQMPEEFADRIYQLRKASDEIVQAVKNVKHLRKNVVKYMISPNKDIRREYNALRYQIAMVIRTIDRLRKEDPDTDVLDFDEYKIAISEGHSVATGELDRLIREGLIAPEMATSLINDYGYARSIVWGLSSVGEILFGDEIRVARDAEALLRLDEEDIEGLSGLSALPEEANS